MFGDNRDSGGVDFVFASRGVAVLKIVFFTALPANYTSANVERSFKGGHHLILHNGSELTVFPLAHADHIGV